MRSYLLLYPIFLPLAAGIIPLLIPRRGLKEGISMGAALATFVFALWIFLERELFFSREWLPCLGINFSLRSYHFSSFILFFISLFGLLVSLYSAGFMRKEERPGHFYAYLLWMMGASSGAVLANNLVLFLVFWGAVLLLLYALLSLGSYKVATKGLFIVGAADFSLILGIALLYRLTGTLEMSRIERIPLVGILPTFTFILMMIGAIAKAGTMPFHTWIPEAAEKVPLPVMAFLPASLDKLLGIYFLARICLDFFKLVPNSGLSIFLMFIGAFTIIATVMMALIQHNLKKLLSYHAVSQVGYMVLGIGTGIPLAMAGGIFHMLNHCVYKCCLFLGGGSVERRMRTTELAGLGGLARIMPLTFLTFFIAALSISGVPPFNGFFSKWMIYQGIIQLNSGEGIRAGLWIIWLLAAMFGSALTLASFMKLIHGTFLSIESDEVKKKTSGKKVKKSHLSMLFPMVVLAGLCVVFGIFAYQVPLKLFILPSVRGISSPETWIGWWQPGFATLFIILGIIVGLIIYSAGKIKLARVSEVYVGGETVSPEMRVSGIDFYDTLEDFIGLRTLYKAAEKGALDIYQGMLAFVRGVAHFLRALDRLVDLFWRGLSWVVLLAGRGASLAHTGNLHTYTAWFLLGIVLLLLTLILAPGLFILR